VGALFQQLYYPGILLATMAGLANHQGVSSRQVTRAEAFAPPPHLHGSDTVTIEVIPINRPKLEGIKSSVRYPIQKVWVFDSVFVWLAKAFLWIDSLNAHQLHQPTDAFHINT
jgi:hypothetical protein